MQVGKMQNQAYFNRNSQSLFLLKRSDNSSTHGSIEVNFSPITLNLSDGNSLDVQKQVLKSYPIFNTDKKHFTPCFILEVDKGRYVQNSSIYFSLHEKKIEELCQEKQMIFVPKPSINCSFCCICKTAFDDYLTHVTNPQHKKALQNSEFTNEIVQFCEKYNSNYFDLSNKAYDCQKINMPSLNQRKLKKITKSSKKSNIVQKDKKKVKK